MSQTTQGMATIPHQIPIQPPSHGRAGQQYPAYQNGSLQHQQAHPQSLMAGPARQHELLQSQMFRPGMDRSATEPMQHGGSQAYGVSMRQSRSAVDVPPLSHEPRLHPAQVPAPRRPVPVQYASGPSQQHRAQDAPGQGAPSAAQRLPDPPYPLSDLPPHFSTTPAPRPAGRRASDQIPAGTQSRPPLMSGGPRYPSGDIGQSSPSPPSSVGQSPGQPLHTPSPILQGPGASGPPLPGKVPLNSAQQQYSPNPGNYSPPIALEGPPGMAKTQPLGQTRNFSKRHSLPALYANGAAPPPIYPGQDGAAARIGSQAQPHLSTPEQALRIINEQGEVMPSREASPLSTQSRTRPVSAVSSIQPPIHADRSSADYTLHRPPLQTGGLATAQYQYAPPRDQSPQSASVSSQGQSSPAGQTAGHEWMATQGLTPMAQLTPQPKQSSWTSYLSSSRMKLGLAEKSKDKLTKLRKSPKPGNPEPSEAVRGVDQLPIAPVSLPPGPPQQGHGHVQGPQYYQQQQQQQQYSSGVTGLPCVPPAPLQHQQQHIGQPYSAAYPSQSMPEPVQGYDRSSIHQDAPLTSTKIRRKPPPGQVTQAQVQPQPQSGSFAGGPLSSHPLNSVPSSNPGLGNPVNSHWVTS
jgi:hypothetical protein